MAYVEIESKDNVPHRIYAIGDSVKFGRDKKECAISAAPNAAGVSRVHATLEWTTAGVMLTDTSTHGSTVDGELVKGQTKKIRTPCHLKIGDTEYQIHVKNVAEFVEKLQKKRATPMESVDFRETKRSKCGPDENSRIGEASLPPSLDGSRSEPQRDTRSEIEELSVHRPCASTPAKTQKDPERKQQPTFAKPHDFEDVELPQKKARRGPVNNPPATKPSNFNNSSDILCSSNFSVLANPDMNVLPTADLEGGHQLPSHPLSIASKKQEDVFEIRPSVLAPRKRSVATKRGVLGEVTSGRHDEELDEDAVDEKEDAIMSRMIRTFTEHMPSIVRMVDIKKLTAPLDETRICNETTFRRPAVANFKRFNKASQGSFNKSLPQVSRSQRTAVDIELVDFRAIHI